MIKIDQPFERARGAFASGALRRALTSNSASIGVNVAATNVLRIVSSMTLTRLLDTTAFGIVGLITSIAYMLAMISDVGVAAFIIQHRDGDDPRFLDEIWTIKFIRGIVLAVVMAVIAIPAATWLGKPVLGPVIAVWSINFLFDGVASLALMTGTRRQRIWRVNMAELIANVATFIASVSLALVFRSYWALVGATVLGGAVKAFLSFAMFHDGPRRFSLSRARSIELWGFSRYIAVSSILSLIVLQADKLVLARMMPLATYGLYAIATTLAIAPDSLATPYATRVLLPAYAQVARERRQDLPRAFYAFRRKVVLLYMAAVGGLIGAAPLVVRILYDARYQGVAPLLQLLAVRTLLRMPAVAAQEVLTALGYTRSTMTANICRTLWLAGGAALAAHQRDVMLLIIAVSTDEVAALLCFAIALHRERLLDLAQEALGFIVAGVGIAAGTCLSLVGMRLI